MASERVLRDSDGATIDLLQEESEHADTTARAKRVILTDSDGTAFSSSNPLNVDTELTLDGNVIIDNVSVFATDISDSSTTSFGLVDASGHLQSDVLNIVTVDATGQGDVPITLDGEDVTTIPGPIQGRTFKYEDTNFQTGESPITLDVNTDLGRNGVDGYIINDGSGNILIEFSNNGTNYGSQHTIQKGEVIDLENLDIDSIRLTWVADSGYRILVV